MFGLAFVAAVQALITVAASPAILLSMGEPVEIMPYDPAWPALFAQWGTCLRLTVGDAVARIDHIGSTAVPGLAAKPVIDTQISVASLEATDAFLRPLTEIGLVYRATIPTGPNDTSGNPGSAPDSRARTADGQLLTTAPTSVS